MWSLRDSEVPPPRLAEPGDPPGGGPDAEKQRGLAIKEREKTKKPPMYKVLLHNDDYTTKEFVVMVLEGVFHKSEVEATKIMMHVHQNGVGVAGIYTHQVAETKVAKTMALARRYEFPLQLSIEPAD